MEEKEILERILSLEFEQKTISKQLDKIENTLVSLNNNVSAFTQEITLLKANSHNKEECKSSLVKEIKTEIKKDIFDSFSYVGKFTILLGAIVGGLGAWLRYWLESK